MFPKKITCAFAALITTLTASCSNQPTVINQQFVTNIADDGSKRFELLLELPVRKSGRQAEPENHSNKRREGKRRDGQNGAKASDKTSEKLQDLLAEQLAQVMEKTAFCKQGYMIFERNLSRDFLSIRGECNESFDALQ